MSHDNAGLKSVVVLEFNVHVCTMSWIHNNYDIIPYNYNIIERIIIHIPIGKLPMTEPVSLVPAALVAVRLNCR